MPSFSKENKKDNMCRHSLYQFNNICVMIQLFSIFQNKLSKYIYAALLKSKTFNYLAIKELISLDGILEHANLDNTKLQVRMVQIRIVRHQSIKKYEF